MARRVIGGRRWTCSRCDLRIGYMVGREPVGLPPGMSRLDGELICLSCRRALIIERAKASYDGTAAGARRHIARALVRDELGRDPDRTDGAIAKSAQAKVAMVREERQRLEEARDAGR